MRSHADNPFLKGNFAPVLDERDDVLSVQGELPRELHGVLLRNGPNPRFTPLGSYHWFDGEGMAHGIWIEDGKARYANRWVRTREFLIEEREGRALWRGTEAPPDFTNPHGMMKHRANTSFMAVGGRLFALWEAGEPYELSPHDLSTLGKHTFEGKLKGACSAHPKLDPETGELFFFGYAPLPPYLQYYVASPDGRIEQREVIDIQNPVMMHDFCITERYAIFFDLPACFRIEHVLAGKSLVQWEPEHGARIGVMDRYGRGDSIRWFEVPPFFCYHFSNAYEQDGRIVISGGRMNAVTMVASEDVRDPNLLDPDVGRFARWEIDLASGRVSETRLDDLVIGFENCNEALLGRPTRYAFASRCTTPGHPSEGHVGMNALLKYEVLTGKREAHEFGPGVQGGEGVFVPRPGAREEDDGWVLALTHDDVHGVSELRVIHAQAYGEPPIARVRLPRRVPYGFHARWFDATAFGG